MHPSASIVVWLILALAGFVTNGYILRQAQLASIESPSRLRAYANLKTARAWVRTCVHTVNFTLGITGLLIDPGPTVARPAMAILYALSILAGLFVVHALVVLDGLLEAYAVYKV